MTAKFNTREVLNTASDVMTFVVMAGLTVASAATFAFSPMSPARDVVEAAAPITLPLVVVTAKKASEPVHLPLVVVTAKRSSAA